MFQIAFSEPAERRRFAWFALGYLVVWLLTWYAARVLNTLGVASLWYLPGGLRFCCLLLLGGPGLALEVANSLVLIAIQSALSGWPAPDVPLAGQIAERLYNLLAFPLAYAVAVLPLRWRLRSALDLALPLHSVWFVLAALCACALSACAGTFNLAYQGLIQKEQWASVLANWFTGDFIGVLTLSPVLLVVVWPQLRFFLRYGGWSLRRASHAMPQARAVGRKTALIVAACLAVVMLAPGLLGVAHQSPMLALLLLLPLVGVALRYKLRAAVTAILLLDSGVVALVALLQQRDMAMLYQLVMVAIALVGLWLGGAVEARDRLMARLHDFSDLSNDLLWESTPKGALSMSGRLASQILPQAGTDWRALMDTQGQSGLAVLDGAVQDRRAFSRLQIALKTGTEVPLWVSVNGTPLWDDMGEYAGYRGTATDISDAVKIKLLMERYNQQLRSEVEQRTTELHQAHQELLLKEQRLRVLLAAAPVGVLELDEAGRCRYINSNGCTMTACTSEQAQGLHLLEFVHADDRQRVEQVWKLNSKFDAAQSLEFRLARSDMWCAAYWVKFLQADQARANTILVLADSSYQHQQAEQWWTMAHTDLLTGLPNRNLFMDRCAQTLTLARRQNMGVAILWLDLDGFKAVNDRLGHAAGDVLLQQVAQRLKSRMRDSDTMARMGGDEFAVVMTDISTAQSAQQIAQGLVAGLRKVFELPQGQAHISASVGIALFPLHADNVEALMRCADVAMYSAKNAGKDQVQVWHEGSTIADDISSRF